MIRTYRPQAAVASPLLPPSGFTLVELLAVIAIIGTLVGLLLPAVQVARESARMAECSNRIKQVALALHNYEQANKVLPGGVNASITSAWTGSPFLAILPYMEHQKLFNTITSYQGSGRSIPDYKCPSDFVIPLNNEKDAGASNYAFNRGDSYQSTVTTNMTSEEIRGIICESTYRLPLRRISDGLSSTIAIAEMLKPVVSGVLQPPGMASCAYCDDATVGTANGPAATCSISNSPSNLFAKWQGNKFVEDGTVALVGWNRCAGSNWAYARANYWSFTTILAPNGPSGTNNGPGQGILTPRSYHRGGVNAAMMDGSVRFISEYIDAGNRAGTDLKNISQGVGPYGVWGRLGCRGDGQSIDATAY
jgi:prepilin-type N-terminal cleavage/methylation domain-containing protein/prepilin-type processing-associated H-X9-DG protein